MGIDVGTTRIKVVVTDLELRLVCEDSTPTPWVHNNNLSDIDMNLLARTTIELASTTVRKVGGQGVAIGITGFSECGALLGTDSQPLVPGFAWHDPRGDLATVEDKLGRENFESTVAAQITSVVSITKILWQQAHIPEARHAKYFIGAPEWILHTIGAEIVNELSIVSRSGFLDIARKNPWTQAITLVNGGEDFLGRLVGAGEVIGQANGNAPDNLRDAVLTVAGHDHQTAAYHLGAIKDGTLFDSMGTAEAIVRTHKGVISKESMSRLAKHGINVGWTVIPDHQMILAGLPTGISLERMGTMLGSHSPAERNALGAAALEVDRAHHGVKVVGSYHGMDIVGATDGLTPAHLWRAAVEDLTALYDETLNVVSTEVGKYSEVIIGGGWIHNPMVQEVKKKEYGAYTIAEESEPGAMGAAEFAGIAFGVIKPRWN